MGDNYFNKPYQIKSGLRSFLEEEIGEQVDLAYVQIENIIASVFKNENKTVTIKFTDNDKKKIIRMIKEQSPNNCSNETIESIVKFFTDNFTDEEFKEYIDYCIENYYSKQIGKMMYGANLYVGGTVKLVENSKLFPLQEGIIANYHYINDLIKLLDKDSEEFNYDKESLMVADDYKTQIIERFNSIKTIGCKILFINDLVFILATDKEALKVLKKSYKGLNITKILDLSYYKVETKEEINSIDDIDGEMIGNGIFSTTNVDQVVDLINKMKPNTDDDDDDDEINEEEIKNLSEDDECDNTCSCCENVENTSYKPVYCMSCGSSNLTVKNTCTNLEFELNSDDFNVKFVKEEFLDPCFDLSDFTVLCNGSCENKCTKMMYNTKCYDNIIELLQDIVNDLHNDEIVEK